MNNFLPDLRIMKILKIFLALLFALFAIVQYNDPDPFLWICIYGWVSTLFFLSLFGYARKGWVLLSIIVAIGMSIFYTPGVYEWVTAGETKEIVEAMEVDKPYIEESREFLGLWIAIAALFYLYKKI